MACLQHLFSGVFLDVFARLLIKKKFPIPSKIDLGYHTYGREQCCHIRLAFLASMKL
jgi:hypothetical protein